MSHLPADAHRVLDKPAPWPTVAPGPQRVGSVFDRKLIDLSMRYTR